MNSRLLFLPAFALILAGCETGAPIQSSFDPLDAAGGFGSQTRVVDTGYRPGEFVTSVMDQTGFFKKRPDAEADADRLLRANTPMKVISDDGSFVKVELDSGEVGFVSTLQVRSESEAAEAATSGSEVQVWPPPADGTIPIDPAVEPVDPSIPVVPTDIDPDAPVDEPTLPVDPPEPVDPSVGLPPLPGDDEPVPGPDLETTGGDAETAGDEPTADPFE